MISLICEISKKNKPNSEITENRCVVARGEGVGVGRE